MTDKQELMPCPFCGGDAELSYGEQDGKPWPYIECLVCACAVEPDVWNTRPAPLPKEREEAYWSVHHVIDNSTATENDIKRAYESLAALSKPNDVDVEKLYTGNKIEGSDNLIEANDYHQGWNDCIDHLNANGYLGGVDET